MLFQPIPWLLVKKQNQTEQNQGKQKGLTLKPKTHEEQNLG